MNKLLKFALFCTLSLTMAVGFTATASAATSGDYTYEVQADGTAQITGYNGAGGALTIPATVDGIPVTSVGSYIVISLEDTNAALNNTSVTSITFPDSVTSIGYRAFYYCAGITSVNFGSGLKEVGEQAFRRSPITSLNFPSGLTTIGGGAFDGFKGTTLVIPDSVTTLGTGAFSGTTVERVTLSKNITSIEASVFAYCRSLTDIVIPEGVTIIKDRAFYTCDSLVSVSLPSTVQTLSKSAFECCYSLTDINFPDGLTQIKESAFQECGALTAISLPDSITHIDNYAFRYCGGMSDVYYAGSEAQWNAIYMETKWNQGIEQSTIHYNSTGATAPVVETPVVTAPVATATATLSATNLQVNGSAVAAQAYMIDGNNYIKLRDLATMINGTAKNFEVTWNSDLKSIELQSGTAYTTAGSEMAMDGAQTTTATLSTSPIYVDGNLADLTAYNINDNNYFKLRDVMGLFDVEVGYDNTSNTATLTT